VLLDSPRQYGVTQQHKHLKEMHKFTGLDIMPIFCPIVEDFYSGMEVTVPLFAEGDTIEKIKSVYREKYTGSIVKYAECEDLFLPANKLSGKDSMEISVLGNEERILLVARYDNLGKGASGAAIECLNIVLGVDKTLGLDI